MLYTLTVNDKFVTNWTDLNPACAETSTCIQALAVAGATCTIKLERGPDTPLGLEGKRTLILAEITSFDFSIIEVRVFFDDNNYTEVN